MAEIAFLHPWLLLGLLGITLPLIIHLIGKKKAPVLNFAAFDFLLSVNKRLARREKLRQFLLLLLRCLAILCLTLAIARPVPQSALISDNDKQQRLILIIDTSPSMSYLLDGKSLLKHAKDRAIELISHLQPGDLVAVLQSGKTTENKLSADFSKIKQEIKEIKIRAEGSLNSTIEQAIHLLGDTGKHATLILLGDLSRNSLELLPHISLTPAPELRFIDAANRKELQPLSNLALTDFKIERSPNSDLERQFKIGVRNYGAKEINQCKVILSINEEIVQQNFVTLHAQQTSTLTFTHHFENPGVFYGVLKLNDECDESYSIDNEIKFVVHVYKPLHVLAISGDPRNVPIEDELFFVEKAIDAIPAGDPAINLHVRHSEEPTLNNMDFDKFNAILLANIDYLLPPIINKIQNYLNQGGGILFSMGKKIQFETFNTTFKSIIPHPIRDLYQINTAESGHSPLAIATIDKNHPIFVKLDQAAEASLRATQTTGHFHTEIGSIQKTRILLSFDNQAPALIEGRKNNAGRILLLTTSLDMDLSDLALRTVFPAFIQRCLRYLGKAMESSTPAQLRLNDSIQVNLPTETNGFAYIAPSGERIETEVTSKTGHTVLLSDLQELGYYKAEQRIGAWRPSPNYNTALNASLSESDFNPISPGQILKELGAEKTSLGFNFDTENFTDKSPVAQRSWSSLLLLGLWFFLVCETMLACKG
ncbi:MAG: VWA domain-containing protein [Myxococcota bacterium]|jgi:hypothetical protein|nr:VWA domain-containing protein [Myxococcota bacterium]